MVDGGKCWSGLTRSCLVSSTVTCPLRTRSAVDLADVVFMFSTALAFIMLFWLVGNGWFDVLIYGRMC